MKYLWTISASLAIVLQTLVSSEPTASDANLCDDQDFDTADRFVKPNDDKDYYRIYRGQYYWELVGLPASVVKVNGPFKISDLPFEGLGPVNNSVKIVTIGSGALRGYVYKFYKKRWWRWHPSGGPREDEADWYIGHYFDAVYNDGDLDRKGHPRTIAFFDGRVLYWMSEGKVWGLVDGWDREGFVGGKYDEKFPTKTLSAAMVYNDNSQSGQYHVYLFSYGQYCFRPYKGVEGCPGGWKRTWELFNCTGPAKPLPADLPGSESGKSGQTGGADQRKPEERSTLMNLIAIVISFMFYYLL